MDYKPDYAPFIAGYFQKHGGAQELAKAVPEGALPEVFQHWGRAVFSCDAVKERFPELCKPDICPLNQPLSPLEQAKSLIERALFVEDDQRMIIKFKGVPTRFAFNVKKALRNKRGFAEDFYFEVYRRYRIEIDLMPYDPDVGRTVDYVKPFIKDLYDMAETVPSSVAYDVGDTLIKLLQSAPVMSFSEARRVGDVVLFYRKEDDGYVLYVSTQQLRMRLKAALSVLGGGSINVGSLLSDMGIKAVRIQLAGVRQSFYRIDEDLFEELTGQKLTDFLGVEMIDVDELLAKVGFTDGGADNSNGG